MNGTKVMSKRKRKRIAWGEWGEALVIAAVIAIFLRTFFFQIYKIPSTSMDPTLKAGDRIFASKLVYGPKVPFTGLRIPGFGEIQRADIVVFIPPEEKLKFWFKRRRYIKRLIGLGGDRIRIENGGVYINGELFSDPRIDWIDYRNFGPYAREGKEITVPEGKCFFLGDNSDNSEDSRFWGFADEKDIIAKGIFIWWPPSRIKTLR